MMRYTKWDSGSVYACSISESKYKSMIWDNALLTGIPIAMDEVRRHIMESTFEEQQPILIPFSCI